MVAKGRSTKGQSKRQKRFTAEQKAEIVRLSLGGISQYQIAKQFGRAESTIAQVLRRHKPKPKPVTPPESEALSESRKTTARLTNCYVRLNAQLKREAARKQWRKAVAA